MASPILSRGPTCLFCLRQSLSTSSQSSLQLGLVALPVTQQVRGKKTKPPKDRGAVVRLLEDIPGYGRKNAIIRTERARMRNLWFPHKKAEYMTATRFVELGLKRNDEDAIIDRDSSFAIKEKKEEDLSDALDFEIEKPVVKSVDPIRAVTLLNMILPAEMTFRRKVIQEVAPTPTPAPEPVKPRSPLLADTARVSSEPTPPAAPTPAKPTKVETRIFGSVSADDVAARIRSLCQTAAASGEEEAGLIRVESRDVRFVVGAGEDVDRVRTLGKWQVDILLRGEGDEVQVMKKTVVVAGTE